jgi:D-glycero-D-manno-heptose 1,7-bisphosphate phosphatase
MTSPPSEPRIIGALSSSAVTRTQFPPFNVFENLPSGPSRAAFFLDRDGVLIEESGHLSDPAKVVVLPTVRDALRLIASSGYDCCVVTNQAGVAKRYFDLATIIAIHERIDELLATDAEIVQGYYVCPHHPTAGVPPFRQDCDCRKPKPGLLTFASRERNIGLPQSFLIGDKVSDLLAGAAAGCRTVLVRTGHGTDEERRLSTATNQANCLAVVDTLLEAVRTCLEAAALSTAS